MTPTKPGPHLQIHRFPIFHEGTQFFFPCFAVLFSPVFYSQENKPIPFPLWCPLRCSFFKVPPVGFVSPLSFPPCCCPHKSFFLSLFRPPFHLGALSPVFYPLPLPNFSFFSFFDVCLFLSLDFNTTVRVEPFAPFFVFLPLDLVFP